MKILYFDCSSGISGNMVLGSLTEIVGDEKYLVEELKKLNVDGYKIDISKKMKNGISGTYVDVIVDGKDEYGLVHGIENVHLEHGHIHDEENHNHGHSHNHEEEHHHVHENDSYHAHHHHEHRNLNDVKKIIDESSLDDNIKDLAKRIFLRVAKAESKVHGKSIDEVHFHEVGAIDSIIDIVGTAILINKINPDKIISSIVNEGHGFIECAHGTMAVPVPATSEIFASSNVVFKQIDIDTELVTPTGAAIIAELAEEFKTMQEMVTEKIGWGAGYKDLRIPNVLKVYYGDVKQDNEGIVVMETNIDDCTGEVLGYTEELLFKVGALDVFYTPVFMKKNRPAYCLTVTCREEKMGELQDIIFRETTTIGIRYHYESRVELEREIGEIDTKYGKLKVKRVTRNGETFIYPEYESMRELAEKNSVPLKDLYRLLELRNQL